MWLAYSRALGLQSNCPPLSTFHCDGDHEISSQMDWHPSFPCDSGCLLAADCRTKTDSERAALTRTCVGAGQRWRVVGDSGIYNASEGGVLGFGASEAIKLLWHDLRSRPFCSCRICSCSRWSTLEGVQNSATSTALMITRRRQPSFVHQNRDIVVVDHTLRAHIHVPSDPYYCCTR